jgi:hypothetical protein
MISETQKVELTNLALTEFKKDLLPVLDIKNKLMENGADEKEAEDIIEVAYGMYLKHRKSSKRYGLLFLIIGLPLLFGGAVFILFGFNNFSRIHKIIVIPLAIGLGMTIAGFKSFFGDED